MKPVLLSLRYGTILFLLLVISGFETAQKTYTLTLKITNVRNSSGQIGLILYNSSKGFPEKTDGMYQKKTVNAQKGTVTTTFVNVPAGKYAVSLLHDENKNDEMDYNWMGMPTEGFGFSNNPVVRFSAPNFTQCSFELGSDRVQSIKVKYF